MGHLEGLNSPAVSEAVLLAADLSAKGSTRERRACVYGQEDCGTFTGVFGRRVRERV